MASTITDTNILTKPVNVIFTRRFLQRARYKMHYFNGTDPGSIAKHGGSFTAFWRRYEHLTPSTTALSELATTVAFPTRDAVTPTITDVTKAVAKYGAHIVLNEEADVVNFNGQTDELLRVLAVQAGRSLNMVQRNEMEDNATIVQTAGAASDGVNVSAMTTGALDSVINTLERNVAEPFAGMTQGSDNLGTVPILDSYWAITHPDVARDINKLTGFVGIAKYNSQVQVLPNELGFYGAAGLGIRFLSSPDASIDAGAGGVTGSTGLRGATAIDMYSTVVYGRNAVGSLGFSDELPSDIRSAGDDIQAIEVINKAFGSAGAADPLNELSTMGWKAWNAAKILNPAWIRTIRSGATAIST